MTTRVECADFFPVRDRALLAHATQIDPDGWFFRIPARAAAQRLADRGLRAGPHASSPARVPEDDLFAGVREHLEQEG